MTTVVAAATGAAAIAAAVTAAATGWVLSPTPAVRLVASLGAAATVCAATGAAVLLCSCARRACRAALSGSPVLACAMAIAVLPVASPPAAADSRLPAAPPSMAAGAPPSMAGGTAPPGREELAFAAAPLGAPGAARVYVGLDAASSSTARVARAVQAWQDGGGLSRATVLVAVPTGSGWVDSTAVAAAEATAGGDITTIVVPYAQRPSWLEALLGGSGAEAVTTELVAAVSAVLDGLPAQERPRLVLFGESLGARAAVAAAAQWPVDACLAAGTPVFGSARARAAAIDRTPGAQCVQVHNADDPVGRWSLSLLFRPPARVITQAHVQPGRRGPGRWLPVVTFWQASAEMLISLDQPEGHGHRYGTSLAPQWREVLDAGCAATTAAVVRPARARVHAGGGRGAAR